MGAKIGIIHWFDKEFGIDGIIKENLENIKYIGNKKIINNLSYIPNEYFRCIAIY